MTNKSKQPRAQSEEQTAKSGLLRNPSAPQKNAARHVESPHMATTAQNPAFSLKAITSGQRRTLIAAALGWMLDAFDVMLYALVLVHIMGDLGMSKATAGLL